jgi:hypothetical protein
MIAQYETYIVTNPLREVDWRWQLANELAASRHCLDGGPYDDLTLRAARFCRGQIAEGPSSARDEAVEDAWRLSETEDDRRLQIEARLLAGSSVLEVGRCTHESTDVVGTFAGLFFDVESCLDHEDYILCRVLHTPAQNGSPAERLRSCVHRLSYQGGPLIAEAALAHLTAMKAAIAGEYDFRSSPLSLEKRLAVMAIAMTAPLTVRETLQLTEKCPENDLQPDAAFEGVFAGELHDRLDALLDAGPWEMPAEQPFEQVGDQTAEDGEAA